MIGREGINAARMLGAAPVCGDRGGNVVDLQLGVWQADGVGCSTGSGIIVF